jgi:catechol 2,3-dioxygenase-like lactoylglutathione lyase family enzyme
MNGDIDIFHHIGLITGDMAALIARYEQLGFSFTPLSMPRIALTPGGAPEILGPGNRCAIFEKDYLEVLAVIDQERWARVTKAQRGSFDIDPPLARYQGLHVMHFGCDDIESVRRRYAAEGIASSEVITFQRNVDTPTGPQMMTAKCVAFPQGGNLPSLTQIAQHVTPELVLQERYQHHANGARAITEVILCDPAAADVAARYAKIAGQKVTRQSDAFVVDIGRARLIVVAPKHLTALIPGAVPPTLPYLAGFTVRVDDLDKPRAVLRDAKLPFQEAGKRVIVSAADAFGCAVLFES